MVAKPERDDFFAKVEYGLKLAIERLYEQKAANNETAVISVNGEIRNVSARDILEQRKKDKKA
ncbi:MAG: hypothetical protein JWQ38_501 [Flavipsychrobacter sp.]|nr:hypothetical protein [Flavipsychrobacter sp.]